MELPDTVLEDVDWSFVGGVRSSFESFCQSVRQDQLDIEGNDSWDPAVIVLPVQRVSIIYKPHPFEDDEVVNLAAKAESGFSAGELLFKLHNSVVEDLEDRDHHFFEGLTLNSWPVAQALAVYVMRLGS